MCASWPARAGLSPIWGAALRQRVTSSQVPQSVLHARRAECLVPGQALLPTPDDARIPILLVHQRGARDMFGSVVVSVLQRLLTWRRGYAGAAERGCAAGECSGWDVLVPRAWGGPVFHAITMAGARAAGTAQRDLAALELLLPSDVHDYPDTAAGAVHWAGIAAEQQRQHERRPHAKRCPFQHMGVRDPFGVDWLALVNMHAGAAVRPCTCSSCVTVQVERVVVLRDVAAAQDLAARLCAAAPSPDHATCLAAVVGRCTGICMPC